MYSRRKDVFSKRKFHIVRWIALALFIVLVGSGIYTALDNGRVIVKTQQIFVWNLPKALEGFTVLHISDLNGQHFGPGHKQLQSALQGKRYSAVCITGNMVGKDGDVGPFLELLNALDTTKPVFFIAGNNDPSPLASQGRGTITSLANWVAQLQAKGAIYLDTPTALQVGRATVWFSDAAQLSFDPDSATTAYAQASLPDSDYNVQVLHRTQATRAQMTDEDLHIVLTHRPLREPTVYRLQEIDTSTGNNFMHTVDILLAGGTAGGQWRIPFVGPLWSEGWLPGDTYVQGYHYTGNLSQYISGGLGVLRNNPLPGIRLFNTPEISLLTFTSSIEGDVLPER